MSHAPYRTLLSKPLRVFLGGTVNSDYRKRLLSMINPDLDIDEIFFNPIVDYWTPESQEKEDYEKKICYYTLYVITPMMHAPYSIAEVVDDSNKKPKGRTLFCYLKEDYNPETYAKVSFDDQQIRSMEKIKEMVKNNGATVFDNLEEIASYFNKNL